MSGVNIYKLIKQDRLEDFCLENNIIISILNFNPIVRGFCYYSNNKYYVQLNEQHNTFQLRITLLHELVHVFENHFTYSEATNCEEEVHFIIDGLKKELSKYLINY